MNTNDECVPDEGGEGAEEGELVALVLRGDHQLNSVKAESLEAVATPLAMASEERVSQVCGAGFGSMLHIDCPGAYVRSTPER